MFPKCINRLLCLPATLLILAMLGGCSIEGFIAKEAAKAAYKEYKKSEQEKKARASDVYRLKSDAFLAVIDGQSVLAGAGSGKGVPFSVGAHQKQPGKYPAVVAVIPAGTRVESHQEAKTDTPATIVSGDYAGCSVMLKGGLWGKLENIPRDELSGK
jgi:hypothetical protein